MNPDWSRDLDEDPDEFQDCPYWKYGVENHVSGAHRIVGPIYLTANVSSNLSFSILFLLL